MSSPYGPISAPPPGTTPIPQPQQHVQAAYGAVGQGGYGHQPNVPYTQQGPMPYPTQQQPIQQQLQQPQPTSQQPTETPAIQQQPNQNPATQPQPVQAQAIQQPQPIQQPTQPQPVQQPIQPQPVRQPTQPRPLQQQLIQPQPVQHASFAQNSVEHEQSHQQVPFAQHSVEHEQSHQQLPIQAQPETVQAQVRASATSSVSPQRQAQRQAQPEPQPQQQPAGPPYIYDPNTTYADPNVQAWAQYYAQGGRDLAGSVYFISIPGLTDNHAPGSTQQTEHEHDHHAAHQQHQQQSSVADAGSKSTRSASFSSGQGRLSPVGIGGLQIDTTAATGGPMQPTSEAPPPWVLPKKTPPATVMGSPDRRISMSGGPAQRDIGGLPDQLRRSSLRHPGVNS